MDVLHDEWSIGPTPAMVRELLVDDRLERAEEAIGVTGKGTGTGPGFDVLGAEPTSVGSARWDLSALRAASVLGGTNDPTKDSSARPWLALIGELIGDDDVAAAARAARAWYGRLVAASCETEAPLAGRAMAAYIAGIVEACAGNDVVAEHLLETGSAESELDEDPWGPLLSACRFVRAALRGGPVTARVARE